MYIYSYTLLNVNTEFALSVASHRAFTFPLGTAEPSLSSLSALSHELHELGVCSPQPVAVTGTAAQKHPSFFFFFFKLCYTTFHSLLDFGRFCFF